MKNFLYKLNEWNDLADEISEEIIEKAEDVTRQIIDDSLKAEIDNLYKGVLQHWIDTESEYILGSRLDIRPEWSVFGTCYLYDAVNYLGDEALVLMNIVDKTNYSSVYHAFNNLLVMKRYFEEHGKEYKYRQVVVAKSQECAELIYNQIQRHTKLFRIFHNGDVENDLMYLSNGSLMFVNSNHPMG